MIKRNETHHSILSINSNYKKMLLYLIVFIALSCNPFDSPNNEKDYFVATYEMDNLPVTHTWVGPFDNGPLNIAGLDEISGMVASRHDGSFLWVHNDSGDQNRIFLIGTDGKFKGAVSLTGTQNRDWEDIAAGPGPITGINYLYVADIGDNQAQYGEKQIYRIPEPEARKFDHSTQFLEVNGAEKISFVYERGVKMDAETLLVDPWTGDIFVVTKRESPVTVYHLPFPQSTSGTTTAKKYGTLPFTYAVGGDISPDGKMIIIKNYDHVFLWTREDGETMADAFMRQPVKLLYVKEPQGEAIAFALDQSGYYTLSESVGGSIPRPYFYRNATP